MKRIALILNPAAGGGVSTLVVDEVARALRTHGLLVQTIGGRRCKWRRFGARRSTSDKLHAQVDGELAGALPLHLKIVPAALNLLMPEEAAHDPADPAT